MKKLILVIAGLCLIGGVAIYMAGRGSQPAASADPGAAGSASGVESPGAPAPEVPEVKSQSQANVGRAKEPRPTPRTPAPAVRSVTAPSLPFQQALATLTSSQATFLQRQAAWQQVKDSGKLDQLIVELEQGAAANATVAEYPAALGQACLQKAGTITDLREQGILGLKADQSFEAALNLDPGNWEAGFWKAAAMSYWPPQLGKGPEVIERFVDLIHRQEAQQAQPHFAQTYVLLGEQYQKQGYADYARQTWQRGAALFPSDPKLAEKINQLNQVQGEQAAAR